MTDNGTGSDVVRECLEDPPPQAVVTAAVQPHPTTESVTQAEVVCVRKLERLPPQLGYLLLTVGVLGVVLPGPVGTPALIAGGLILWPGAFGRMENWFQRRFPDTHRTSMEQIDRFLNDLERRYPNSTQLRE